jgi:DNA helicase-2/ATP-dependent DNA helicase PcrA
MGYKKFIEEMKINEGYDKKADRVSLLSIHASKGLEFKYVFVCGFEDGNIPFIKKGQDPSINSPRGGSPDSVGITRTDSVEPGQGEEKRLLYVAMTRAKNQLTLIHAKKRNKLEQKPSRFEALICKSKFLIKQEDFQAKKIEIRREKYKQKKSQLKLF